MRRSMPRLPRHSTGSSGSWSALPLWRSAGSPRRPSWLHRARRDRWHRCLDHLLAEELTLRESRRIKTALTLQRVTIPPEHRLRLRLRALARPQPQPGAWWAEVHTIMPINMPTLFPSISLERICAAHGFSRRLRSRTRMRRPFTGTISIRPGVPVALTAGVRNDHSGDKAGGSILLANRSGERSADTSTVDPVRSRIIAPLPRSAGGPIAWRCALVDNHCL